MTDRDRAQGSLASRVNELAALYEFTEQLFRTKSSADIYSAGMDAVRTALGCTRVAIAGHSPWSAEEAEPSPVCIDDVAHADLSATLKALLRRERIGALAFIPLLAHGKLIGKFMIYYDRPRPFGDVPAQLQLGREAARVGPARVAGLDPRDDVAGCLQRRIGRHRDESIRRHA